MDFLELFHLICNKKLSSQQHQLFIKWFIDTEKEEVKNSIRQILRQHALQDKEKTFFGNNSDLLVPEPFLQEHYRLKNQWNRLLRTHSSNEAFLVQIYQIHQLITQQKNDNLGKLAYLFFANTDNPVVTFKIMNTLYKIQQHKHVQNIYLNDLFKLHLQHPANLKAWQHLFWKYPDAEQIVYFLIAPLLQYVLGRAPNSLDEIEHAYQKVHHKKWTKEILLYLYRFSFLTGQNTLFFNLLNQDNIQVISEDLTLIEIFFSESTKEIQNQIIKIIDTTRIDLSSIKYLPWVFYPLHDSLYLELVQQLGIQFIIEKLRSEQDSLTQKTRYPFSYRLINFIKIFSNDEHRLHFFKMLPPNSINSLISNAFLLKEVLILFKEEHRFYLCKNQLRTIIETMVFAPFQLVYTLNAIPQNQRVEWIQEFFTGKKFLELIYNKGDSNNPWNSPFKMLFTGRQWRDLRKYLSTGKELAQSHHAYHLFYTPQAIDYIDYFREDDHPKKPFSYQEPL